MKAIVCEMCGSQDLVKQNGMYVCQNCGTKYDTEEAKKLMVEVAGKISIDNSAKLENYYQLARRARDSDNTADAEKYYDLIRQEDPNSWEAVHYSVLYSAAGCKIAGIGQAALSISNNHSNVLSLIKDNVQDEDEMIDALSQVVNSSQKYGAMLFDAQRSFYYQHIETAIIQETVTTCCRAVDILLLLGDKIDELFQEYNNKKIQDLCTTCWKEGLRWLSLLSGLATKESLDVIINNYTEKIHKYENNYEKIEIKKKGCYVATAIYGSYDCPEVWTLRRYRDYTLAKSCLGRLFIFLYYSISPTLVRWFGETQWFKKMWKPKLDRMVAQLKIRGYADTPYQDRNW